MATIAAHPTPKPRPAGQSGTLWKRIYKARWLFLMLLPGLALILTFDYGPMYGLIIAFKKYSISDGILGSQWVGLENFAAFFSTPAAMRAVQNTLVISLLRLFFGFPAAILLALLINEVADGWFKRFVQSVSYLPHFISWIIIAAVINQMLSPSTGIVNSMIQALGGKSVYFMTDQGWFVPILIISGIWKEIGWSAVIYLAALSGVDPTLYEAAVVDGASRIQRMWHVSLPSIVPVITIVLILSMGGILNAGFDQIFNMYNPRVMQVSDIIDTYVYRIGLVGMDYSFSTAVGLFKSIVGLVLVVGVNSLARKMGGEGYTLW